MYTASQQRRFSWKARGKSFVYAWAGILRFFRSGHNAWLHLAAALIVAILAILLKVSRMEAIVLVFAIALVWMAEMLNTAVEKIMDFISPQYHPQVKAIKDLAAGAVLVTAVAAAIAGIIIFLPKIL